MNTRRIILTLLILLAGMAVSDAAAQESLNKKFRVLVVTGGHGVDEAGFAAMLDAIDNITWQRVSHPDAHAWLKPEKARDYDILLLYDAWENITDEAKADFANLVSGGKPVLALHHCLLSYSKWPEYAEMIGGHYFYLGEGGTINGRRYGYSTAKDKVEMTVKIADVTHPILKGVDDFGITEELYANMYVSPAVHVLLETDVPGMETPVAWTTHFDRGKVFTFQLGHGRASFENDSFLTIMKQAVDWLGRPEKPRKQIPREMRKQGWGNPNFVGYRNMDDDPVEECIGFFYRDTAHYAYYDVTRCYWAVLDGKTNAVKYMSDDLTSIVTSMECVFRDGRWMLKTDHFKDGKYEVDELGRITGTKVYEYVGFDRDTNAYKVLAVEEAVVTFSETIPGLPRGSKTGPIPAFPDREPIETLIMTGVNGAHWWQGSTGAIREMLENTGLFRCDTAVMNGSRGAVLPEDIDFSKYKLVVSNHVPGDWPEQAKTNLEQYVKNGGGLVLLHGATLAFAKWPEYNEMMGLGAWMNRNENDGPYVYWKDGEFVRDETPGWAGYHGRQHSFVVVHRVPDHPILKGLPTEWLHFKDELYGKMRGPAKNMEILATAYDDPDENFGIGGSDRHEPMLWTVRYGDGRVFVDAMGHAGDDVPAIYALECTGFQVTFLRGCEWAATGEVTQPVPDDFPTKTEHSFRRDFR